MRVGLHYLLCRLVEKKYVGDWAALKTELQRIARVSPGDEASVEQLLESLRWEKVFDFCERVYGHLANDEAYYNHQTDEWDVVTPKSKVQEYIAGELQQLFVEENLAFEFSDGLVRRRGRRHTSEQVSRAELVMGDQRLSVARKHFSKALRYFRNVSQPDPENVVKESVCAVEAVARALFPDNGSTLGDVVKAITGNDPGQLPPAIAKTFHSLYGFRSGGEGVGHGGATGGVVTKEVAEYVLSSAASQIILLVDVSAAAEPDVPF
jgi:hypothetical protein